jgi:two-component system, NarL family, captular synthesis response regulator RcsB
MEQHIHVIVADDHPVIRFGVENSLDDISNVTHMGSASNSTELMTLLSSGSCDVLITDYAMPGGLYGDGLELITHLRMRYPDLCIIVLTGMNKPVLIRALLARGIRIILSKVDDIANVRTALQAAQTGRRYFSPTVAAIVKALEMPQSTSRLSQREAEVIKLYLAGATINAIAQQLQRSKQTISTQKVNAMRKLGVANDADLFKYAAEAGLTDSTESTDNEPAV